jgi:murein L,D-transpeptidase YcbB/YkuD
MTALHRLTAAAMASLSTLLSALLLAALLAAAPAAAADRELLRERIEAMRKFGDPRIGAGQAQARALIAGLYEARGFAPLWDDPARVRALLRAIDASLTHGLDPRDYHADRLARPLPAGDARAAVERELLLTDAFMRLGYHLQFGKVDARALQRGWNFTRTLAGADPATALAAALAASDPHAKLESLAPAQPAYAALRRVLAELRVQQQRGGWPVLAAGPALRLGAQGPRVAALRARLAASGDLPAPAADPAEPAVFDDALDAAVRGFQARHGLDADGVVGRATLVALNVPVAARIAQVRANLERLRWVARDLVGDHLKVDIAGFEASLWLDGREAWRSRVIVGRAYRRTPEFRSTMEYLVLNPEWVVPPTILREDVLPRVLRDRGYLARQRMRLLDRGGRVVSPAAVDWDAVRAAPGAFAYRIVQAPGPDNALGRIRFMAPNEHLVFLHDTPERELFERPVRAFSSGCIRVERPLELAELLLADPERWGPAQIVAAIDEGRTRTLPVRRRVPLLLLYHTARAGDGDRPEFRPDLYRRDAPIVRALAAPFRYAPVARR